MASQGGFRFTQIFSPTREQRENAELPLMPRCLGAHDAQRVTRFLQGQPDLNVLSRSSPSDKPCPQGMTRTETELYHDP